MTTFAPKQQRVIVPEGTHLSRCISFVHVGTIQDTYMGELREMNKLRLTFEFPEEKAVFKDGDDAKPFIHSQEYTLSMGQKSNLRKLVEGILGKKFKAEDDAYTFDLESLVDKCCLLNIVHKTSKTGNVRAEIASASGLMKGQKCPEAFNESRVLTYSNFDEKVFESLPDFLKDKIKTSFEYRQMKGTLLSDADKEILNAAREAEKGKGEKPPINTDEIAF